MQHECVYVCVCGGEVEEGQGGVEVEGREETTIDELWPQDGVDNKLPSRWEEWEGGGGGGARGEGE